MQQPHVNTIETWNKPDEASWLKKKEKEASRMKQKEKEI